LHIDFILRSSEQASCSDNMYLCILVVVLCVTCKRTYVCNSGGFSQGMRLTNGDGTVPLLSLGYMCNEGWINEKYPYNPANVSLFEKYYSSYTIYV
jgi:hypothetical protein